MQSLAQKQSPSRLQPKSALAKPDASAAGSDLHAIQNLQRSAGNQAVLRLLQSPAPDSSDHPNSPGTGTPLSPPPSPIAAPPLRPTPRLTLQTKLTVNTPGDAYEQEADRVAEQVMRLPEPQRACSCGGTCDDCKKKQDSPHLQMKSVSGSDVGQTEAPPSAHEVLRQPGQPLDTATRAFMEPRFSQDFSGVRIHTGNLASDSARDVAARAYTVGSHIVFRDGEFSPEDDNGRRLLAHELIHTIQQPSASGMIQRQPASEAPSSPDAARKISTLMSLYAIYVDRLDYIEKQDGTIMALINPQGHHFVEITWDAAAPKLQSFIVIDEETWSISNFNFDTNRFETQEEHIKQELIEVKLSFWERLANSARFSARVVQGVGTCVGGAAESVGFGAYAACAYGADVVGAGYRELQGQDSRTLSNQLVTKGLSQVLSPELSQKIANYTEIAVDAAMLAQGVASARASKLGIPKTATKVPSSQVAPKTPELVAGDAEATAASGKAKAAAPARANATDATSPGIPDTLSSAKPMKAPPGRGPRGTVNATAKTLTSSKPARPLTSSKSEHLSDPEYSVSPDTPAPAPRRVRGNTRPFLDDQLKKLSNPSHPLRKLVIEKVGPDGTKTYSWRTTTFQSEKGDMVTGRYEGNEGGVVVQVGHAEAFAAGGPEIFMLEDADLNQLSGQTIENLGAFSTKVAVVVQDVIVDLQSLLQWERLGEVPAGTAASAKPL